MSETMNAKAVSLYYQDAKADKEYHLQLEPSGAGYLVNFQFGRRGGTLQSGTKTTAPVPREKAEQVFAAILREKVGKGYREPGQAKAAPSSMGGAAPTAYPVELLEEITQSEALRLAQGLDYLMQEKRDGQRRQIRKSAAGIVGYNRRGLPVPLPASIAGECLRIPHASFLLDGEIEGERFVAFDLLELDGADLADVPYQRRFELLRFLDDDTMGYQNLSRVATWSQPEEKLLAMQALLKKRGEGVVFKLADAHYQPGRNGQHKKFKFVKTCSAKVLELRPNGKESIAVGLLDGREWVPVGVCSTIGKTLPQVGDVVEVRYLYATEARRLYQARLIGIRQDLDADACGIGQLQFKQGVRS